MRTTGSVRSPSREDSAARPAPVLSGAGHAAGRAHRARVPERPWTHVDILTLHEGEDLAIPNCRILPDSAPSRGCRNIRPGFSLKKVLCDVADVRLVPAAWCAGTRYDLIHAVEESAFIAAASGPCRGAVRLRHGFLAGGAAGGGVSRLCSSPSPSCGYCESVAVRRSLGVLTVCAALEDVALAHAPGQAGRPGRGHHPAVRPRPAAGQQRLRTASSEEATRPLAMYVGNLERYQGIDLMLDGFRHALYRGAGRESGHRGRTGGGHPHYQRVAARLGISAQGPFPRSPPVDVLPSLLRQADVLVSPRVKGSTPR